MLRQRATSVAILVFALTLASCASPTTAAPEFAIRPITDILVLGPEFTDIGAETATVLVETNIPVACAVVYGTTPAYGQIAVDSDMAGGGHTDHHPLLTGLKPDTVYYARLQGVGPDGTLYRSEEYTFRTPPADAQMEDSSNLASIANGARVVGVSRN